MVRKFYTSGLTLMVVAGLTVGIAMAAVHADEDRGGKYGGDYLGKPIQPAQANANQIQDRYSITSVPTLNK